MISYYLFYHCFFKVEPKAFKPESNSDYQNGLNGTLATNFEQISSELEEPKAETYRSYRYQESTKGDIIFLTVLGIIFIVVLFYCCWLGNFDDPKYSSCRRGDRITGDDLVKTCACFGISLAGCVALLDC